MQTLMSFKCSVLSAEKRRQQLGFEQSSKILQGTIVLNEHRKSACRSKSSNTGGYMTDATHLISIKTGVHCHEKVGDDIEQVNVDHNCS